MKFKMTYSDRDYNETLGSWKLISTNTVKYNGKDCTVEFNKSTYNGNIETQLFYTDKKGNVNAVLDFYKKFNHMSFTMHNMLYIVQEIEDSDRYDSIELTYKHEGRIQ